MNPHHNPAADPRYPRRSFAIPAMNSAIACRQSQPHRQRARHQVPRPQKPRRTARARPHIHDACCTPALIRGKMHFGNEGTAMAAKDDAPPGPEPGDTGMDKPAMKKLLKRAQSGPVSCALAQGDAQGGGLGLILLDKIKPPKVVLRSLKDKFPSLKTPLFGTASVDPDKDAKLVVFRMNKRAAGLDRRVRKSLKGTGYSKVQIQLASQTPEDEDAGTQ